MNEVSLMDMVLTTVGVLITLALLSCLCCVSMKISDLKMKSYIIEMAKTKGLHLDPDKLDPKNYQPPKLNDNCTIMVPDVGIIL